MKRCYSFLTFGMDIVGFSSFKSSSEKSDIVDVRIETFYSNVGSQKIKLV